MFAKFGSILNETIAQTWKTDKKIEVFSPLDSELSLNFN